MSLNGVQGLLLVPSLQVALEVVLLCGAVITIGAPVGPFSRVGPQMDGQLGGGLAGFATEAAAVVRTLVVGRNIVKGREKVAGWRVTYECGDSLGLSWRRMAHIQAGHGLRHQPQGHASVTAECLQETK